MSQRVILDCDNTMGQPYKEVDDGLTLLYLLGRPDIDLLGITTVIAIKNVTFYSEKAIAREMDSLGANVLVLPKPKVYGFGRLP